MRPPHIAFTLLLCLYATFGIAQNKISDSIISEDQLIDSNKSDTLSDAFAPVTLSGDTLFLIKYSPLEYPVSYRAGQISQRLESLSKDYEKGVDTIYTKKEASFVSVMYNDEIAFIVTENDARSNNISLHVLADSQVKKLKEALKEDEKYNLSTREWLIRIGYFMITLVILILVIKIINWAYRKLIFIYLSLKRNSSRRKKIF